MSDLPKDCCVLYTSRENGVRAEIQRPVAPLADPRLCPPETLATGIGPTKEQALANARRAL